MAEGFLSRWSQRKQALRAGQPVAEVIDKKMPPALAAVAQEATKSISKRDPDARPDTVSDAAPASAPGTPGPAQPDAPPKGTPAPTLDDVQALQPGDSFARFVAPDVSPSVRNAAMKKLFADPHYNVMDGLDIYIDDYSQPSPLPAAMLQKMVSAQFMKLVDEPTEPDAPVTQAALQSDPLPNPEPDHHDDPDLRLQPNDAAGRAAFKRQPERAPDAAQQPVPPPGR